MAQAPYCDDLNAMLDVARTEAERMLPPLHDAEIVKTARSAWGYSLRGDNWFGVGKRVVSHFDEIDGLMQQEPDAYLLLQYLRRKHGAHAEFYLPNDMRERMPGGGWALKRMQKARSQLIARHLVIEVHPASSFHGPAVYRWTEG